MAEPLPRRSGLDGVYRQGLFGTTEDGGPGVTLVERHPLLLVQVSARPGRIEPLRRALEATSGVLPSPHPNTASVAGNSRALWCGPGSWLLVRPQDGARDFVPALRAALDETGAALVDLSSARTVLRISGPQARAVLESGTRIDLHPTAMSPDCCAATGIGPAHGLIHALDADSFDLYVPRSLGRHFWEWLIHEAAQYGYHVGPRLSA